MQHKMVMQPALQFIVRNATSLVCNKGLLRKKIQVLPTGVKPIHDLPITNYMYL